MSDIWTIMLVFYAFCAGLIVGIYVPRLLQWYNARQEARWQEMRDAIPPTKVYPRRVVEFREPK